MEVTDSAGTVTIAAHAYDGLNRRITRGKPHAALPDNDTIHYYYNEEWQVLEERFQPAQGSEDSDPKAQYVYHPYYIDAIALRYYDANTDGDRDDPNEGEHFYLQDANFNVTAVVDDSGTVFERYAYTPYGEVTYLDASFGTRTSSQIGNEYLYTGRRLDPESGLQLNRYRYYHQQLGRWVSRDPIGYEGSEWSLYEYVQSHVPVSIDPIGLKDSCVTCFWRRPHEDYYNEMIVVDGERVPKPRWVLSFTICVELDTSNCAEPECESCKGAAIPKIKFFATSRGEGHIREFRELVPLGWLHACGDAKPLRLTGSGGSASAEITCDGIGCKNDERNSIGSVSLSPKRRMGVAQLSFFWGVRTKYECGDGESWVNPPLLMDDMSHEIKCF